MLIVSFRFEYPDIVSPEIEVGRNIVARSLYFLHACRISISATNFDWLRTALETY